MMMMMVVVVVEVVVAVVIGHGQGLDIRFVHRDRINTRQTSMITR
jgi:hypothetical protein